MYVTEINVDKVYFALGGKKESTPLPTPPPAPSANNASAAAAQQLNREPTAAEYAETDDDYPF